MSEPTLYQIDDKLAEMLAQDEGPSLGAYVRRLIQVGVLVPVEPDPALYPDNADNECAKETRLKSAANYCVRPRGHEGMHLALTYWGAGIGGDE